MTTEIKDYRNIKEAGVQILSSESWSKPGLGNLMKPISIKYIWQDPGYMSQEKLKGNGVSIHVQSVQKFYCIGDKD